MTKTEKTDQEIWSEQYWHEQSDDEYGEYFQSRCNTKYLMDIHLINDFGLNETDYFTIMH